MEKYGSSYWEHERELFVFTSVSLDGRLASGAWLLPFCACGPIILEENNRRVFFFFGRPCDRVLILHAATKPYAAPWEEGGRFFPPSLSPALDNGRPGGRDAINERGPYLPGPRPLLASPYRPVGV